MTAQQSPSGYRIFFGFYCPPCYAQVNPHRAQAVPVFDPVNCQCVRCGKDLV